MKVHNIAGVTLAFAVVVAALPASAFYDDVCRSIDVRVTPLDYSEVSGIQDYEVAYEAAPGEGAGDDLGHLKVWIEVDVDHEFSVLQRSSVGLDLYFLKWGRYSATSMSTLAGPAKRVRVTSAECY